MKRSLPSVLTVTVFAIVFSSGCGGRPNPAETKSAAEIRKLHGEVLLDEKRPGNPVVSVNLRRVVTSDRPAVGSVVRQ